MGKYSFARPVATLRLATIAITALLLSHTSGVWGQEESSGDAAQKYSAAVALQNQQLYDLAADEWSGFVKCYPKHELAQKANYYLGVCRFQQGQYDRAEQAFAAAVQQGGRFKLMPSAYLNLGLAQFNQETKTARERAVKSLSALVDRFSRAPEREEGLFYLAESHYALGNRRSAISAYERALKSYPKHPRRVELLYGLGIAATEDKRGFLARDAFSKLVSANANSKAERALIAEARIRLADLMLEAGKANQAEQLLADAARDESSQLADYALLRLAESRLLAKQYKEAAANFAAVVKKFPKSKHRAAAFTGSLKASFLAGQYEQVVTLFEQNRSRPKRLAALEPTHWLTRAHLKLKNYDEAAKVARAAVSAADAKAYSKEEEAWIARLEMDVADAYFESPSKLASAESQYAKVADRFPKSAVAPEASYMAALAAVRQEKYKQAAKYAQTFQRSFANRDKRLAVEVSAIYAEALLQLGDFQKSARHWKKLIRERPEEAAEADWPIRLAVCHQREENHEAIVSALRRYRPKDAKLRHEAALMLAAAQAESGRGESARRTLQQMLSEKPTDEHRSRGQLLLASVLRKSGNTDEALRTLSTLTSGNTSAVAPAVHLEQADLLYDSGDFAQAVASYERVVRSGERAGDEDVVADGLIGMGWSLIETGAAKQANATFRKVLSEHPQHSRSSDALYGAAVSFQQMDQFTDAIPLLKRFIASAPNGRDKVDARYVLGMCYAGSGKHESAVRTLSDLIASYPKYESADQALYELAWSLDSLGRDDEAAKSFEALATLFPGSELAGEAAFRFAEAKYEAKQHKTAAKFYQLAAKRGDGPIREHALHKLGWTYFRSDAFAKAAQAFERQLQESRSGERATDGRLMLAECAFQQQDYQRALNAFETGLQSAGDEKSRLVELAMLHAGQAAGQLKQWSKSLGLLERCVRRFPDSKYTREANYEQARALQATGKRSEAKKLFSELAESDSDLLGARARFMLGELQFAEKDFPAAIRTFFKVAYGYGYPNAPKQYRRWQADAMFEAARCCESTKRVDAARKLYKDLVAQFPESDKAETARRKLEP